MLNSGQNEVYIFCAKSFPTPTVSKKIEIVEMDVRNSLRLEWPNGQRDNFILILISLTYIENFLLFKHSFKLQRLNR